MGAPEILTGLETYEKAALEAERESFWNAARDGAYDESWPYCEKPRVGDTLKLDCGCVSSLENDEGCVNWTYIRSCDRHEVCE